MTDRIRRARMSETQATMTATPVHRPQGWSVVPCLLLGLALLVGCGEYGGGNTGGGGSSSSSAATPLGGGGALPDPVTSIPAFETNVLPMLQANCASCHSGSGPGTPSLAHANSSTAYAAVVNNQKVNLGNPIASRLVQRLAVDLHYCWGVLHRQRRGNARGHRRLGGADQLHGRGHRPRLDPHGSACSRRRSRARLERPALLQQPDCLLGIQGRQRHRRSGHEAASPRRWT